MNSTAFYKPWIALDYGKISGGALGTCIPDLLIMLIIITIDALLKVRVKKEEGYINLY